MLKRAKVQKSLTFAANYLLENYKEAAERAPTEEAVTVYLDQREKDKDRGLISRAHEEGIRKELGHLSAAFAGKIVAEISVNDLEVFIETSRDASCIGPSLKTLANRRGYLSNFFSFCLGKGYVSENPALKLPRYGRRTNRGTSEILSAEKAAELMLWLETYQGQPNRNGNRWGQPGCLVPYFALALFAGIRPDWENGEISKIQPKSVRLDTGAILIEPEVAKGREKRVITIRPNLRQWLEAYPLEKFPILPKRRAAYLIRDARKHWQLSSDVLRHTYISMLVGATGSVEEAAIQAGNSESIIRRHYLNLSSREEAKRFWSIVPTAKRVTKRKRRGT